VALNANCTIVACAAGSAQDTWLRNDLASTSRTCVLAAWHQPRFSSGTSHGNDATVTPFWNALQQYNADLVLGGHVHNYERFAAQLPDGTASATGIREFVVGTGGKSLDTFGTPVANSQVRLQSFGVLRLTLGANAYSWQFVNEAGAVLDSGTGTCH
jgi:Calcineurin-like phosphoesterase